MALTHLVLSLKLSACWIVCRRSWGANLASFTRASDDAFSAAVGAPESYADFRADRGAAVVERAVAELNAHLARKGASRRCRVACQTGAGCSNSSKLS
jgi:hypothetical protein